MKKRLNIAIDLTWVKPKKSGGVEAYIRNLLNGFQNNSQANNYFLLLSKDNYDSFAEYESDNFSLIKCNCSANNVKFHLLWQNIEEPHILKKEKYDVCFFPVYERPIFKIKGIKTVTTIHDLLALHYPKNFSKLENIWFRFGWKYAVKNSDCVVAITDYTKNDIELNYKAKNVVRIYNPIIIDKKDMSDFKKLKSKYNIEKNNYYYTVSSTYPHKNLMTLINVIKKYDMKKLVISGVNGYQQEQIIKLIREENLADKIILTGFVTDAERNCLIKNSNIFLFPSVFEGFGMPPIEAMMLGKKVITTKCASLYEVTEKKCYYINNPYDIDEWKNKIENTENVKDKQFNFPNYEISKVAEEYCKLFEKL